jgi:hypothetical protein
MQITKNNDNISIIFPPDTTTELKEKIIKDLEYAGISIY